jgi:isocitrate lyase
LQPDIKRKGNMTKKRKQENLERLLKLEQELLSQGKRLSQTFYGMKKSAEEALAAA